LSVHSLVVVVVSYALSYIIPLSVGVVSYGARWVTDLTCSATVCKASSEVLSHTYAVVWSFLFIIALTKLQLIKEYTGRLLKAMGILMNSPKKANDKSKKD
jgi:hypothetical protein